MQVITRLAHFPTSREATHLHQDHPGLRQGGQGGAVGHARVLKLVMHLAFSLLDKEVGIYLGLCTASFVTIPMGMLLPEEHLLGHPHQQLVHVLLQDSRGFYELGIRTGGLVFPL